MNNRWILKKESIKHFDELSTPCDAYTFKKPIRFSKLKMANKFLITIIEDLCQNEVSKYMY